MTAKNNARGRLSSFLRQITDGVEPGVTGGILAAGAKIMEDFLIEGKLNPAINPTQKDFYKILAAGIIEDDFPFSTCETVRINRLFKCMHSQTLRFRIWSTFCENM